MPKLKDFLQAQALKAGYNMPADALASVPDFEVPAELSTALDNGLISLTDAKNNHPEIKGFYQKQALDTFDKIIKGIVENNPDLAADEDLKNERSTFKRVELLYNKVDALAAKKAGATGGKAKDDIQKEIDKLQAEIRQEKEGRQADKAAHDKALTDFKRNTSWGTMFGSKKTIHDSLPANIKNAILSTLVQEEMAALGIHLDFDETGKTVLRKADGTNYYGENNVLVTPDAFLDKTLAKHKQLVQSNGQPAAGATPPTGQTPPSGVPGETPKNGTALLNQLNDQALADFIKGTEQHTAQMR